MFVLLLVSVKLDRRRRSLGLLLGRRLLLLLRCGSDLLDGACGTGGGLEELGVGFLVLDELLGVDDVAPAEVVLAELLVAGNRARGALGVAAGTLVGLGLLLFFLGLVARAHVIVGGLALHEAPDAVHDLGLVAPNLEVVGLAELVEDAGRAIVELFAGLGDRRIFDLVGLENFLGLGFGLIFRNLGAEVDLDKGFEHLVDEVHKLNVKVGRINLVLRDEPVDDFVESGHFESLLYTFLLPRQLRYFFF